MSSLNFDQLRAFLYVVRLGGVRRAAEALSLTQPAVSARIRTLEATLREDLFDRSGGAMKLTRRGEILVGYAERAEHLAGLIERDLVDPEGVENRLRIGVSETVAQSWLPELIYRLHAAYPRLEIEFNVDISVNLRAGLLNHALDLAILLGPISDYTVNNVTLPDFELVWYASACAPRHRDSSAYFARPVLTYARQTRPYRELREALLERIGPDVSLFPSSSLSACFRLVEADLGIAALPRVLGKHYIARGSIREFDPGWHPAPLRFTASYRAEPYSRISEAAARLAAEVADAHHCDQQEDKEF